MKKLFLLVLILLTFSLILYSQENEESDSILIMRHNNFYVQRSFPNMYIPEDGYLKAIRGRDSLRQANGLYMNSGTNSWITLGPKPGEFDMELVSGRGQVVAIDPTRGNPCTVYYGAGEGGLYKSTNVFTSYHYFVNWTQISNSSMPSSSGSIAIYTNPDHPYPIVYYGTGEPMDWVLII